MFQATINPNTLNDFSNGVYSGGSLSSINGNRIMLFLYSPHVLPDQVLRSFEYSFTPDFVDALSQAAKVGTLEFAVGKERLKSLPGGQTAIMPSSEGKIADTNNWNNVWTFTLVIDLQQASFNGIIAPATRKIASGYVVGEPGTNDIAGNFLLNEQAVLVFTHVTNLNVRRSFNPNLASKDGYAFYPDSMDYASESVPMYYNEDMFLGSPRELLREQINSPTGVMNYNALSLTHVKDGHAPRAIKNEMRAPKAQLSHIMRAIDCGLDQIGLGDGVHDKLRSSSDDYIAPVDQALNTVVDNLASGNMFDIVTGIDTSQAMSIQQLQAIYPNMEVYPYQIRNQNTFGWDVANQVGQNYSGQVNVVMSPKQQFSSLAATVIQSVCSALGISTVAFSYRWLDSDGFVVGKHEAFQLSKFDLMVPRPAMATDIANQMKMYLDDQLFDIIHSCCGEFEINALCDMAGTNLIDLRLYWYPDPQDGSYFQTDAKLGGIINPMVGTLSTINSNALSLDNLTRDLIGRDLAVQDFPTSVPYM